ncbi:hypothetical protein D9756_009485 [Leucocoprinus leucothites]|uniref:Uncharacterized protein n=1 Tax=Leucocoprinus leucothites TaxID=201217 RepID=A0A8H5CX97_9AGAR|nr:hypothetical protein D9756_009485 [Leucoagaricus leucothites]
MSSGVALITGSSRGIGRAIALKLAADGYNIALNDLASTENDLHDIEREITETSRKVIVCLADVSQEEEVVRMIDDVVKRLGGLNVMVANAGICIPRPFLESTLDEWDAMFNVNGKGVYLCYKYAGKQMIKQGGGGRIIGACSVAGKQGIPLMSLYSATKFTVRSLTQSAAAELGKYGITVNAYAPGFVKTSMMDQFAQDAKQWGVTDTIYDNAGKPEDIATLVSYLASPAASYVNGQSISINGGRFFD